MRIITVLSLIVLLTGCTNIFNPKDKQTVTDENLDELNERSELMAYAEAQMLISNYSNAVLAYDKVILLDKLDSEARLYASIAVFKKDQLQITNALLKMINAAQSGSNVFTIFIDEFNSNPLFSSNGALNSISRYLNDPHTSLFYGDCDSRISTNSINLSYNLLLASLLLMPASLYDSDGDFHYNETNVYPENGGDFLIYINDDYPLEVNYDYGVLTNRISSSRLAIESNFAELTNFSGGNTNFDFSALDDSLKKIHNDTVEFTLEQMKNINIFGYVEIIDDCINRLVFEIADLTNTYKIMMEELLTNAGVETASNLLSGIPLNNCHLDLCGQHSFDTNRGLSTYNFTIWPDFYSVQATNSHVQGYLKLLYDSYQTLTSYPIDSTNFSNYLTNSFLNELSNFYTNYDDLSNNFSNLL